MRWFRTWNPFIPQYFLFILLVRNPRSKRKVNKLNWRIAQIYQLDLFLEKPIVDTSRWPNHMKQDNTCSINMMEYFGTNEYNYRRAWWQRRFVILFIKSSFYVGCPRREKKSSPAITIIFRMCILARVYKYRRAKRSVIIIYKTKWKNHRNTKRMAMTESNKFATKFAKA